MSVLGIALASSVRAAETDRDYWKACAEQAQKRIYDMAGTYGQALIRTQALQREMSAWVANKAENITPEQAAQMFYAQDDDWQSKFFNVMQAQVEAHHTASGQGYAGVPAGEGQWYHATAKLDDSGFETLKAMYDHAVYHRDPATGGAA